MVLGNRFTVCIRAHDVWYTHRQNGYGLRSHFDRAVLSHDVHSTHIAPSVEPYRIDAGARWGQTPLINENGKARQIVSLSRQKYVSGTDTARFASGLTQGPEPKRANTGKSRRDIGGIEGQR